MDIISHGLYGGVAFGRKNRKVFWLALAVGMLPDIFSFGMLWVANLLGLYQKPDWSQAGPPPMDNIPSFISHLYNATHSLIVFLVVFLVIWAIRQRPFWILGAWGLHILIDIPSHSFAFFPTPFLWPISDFKIDGIQWGNPIIYIPNLIMLLILYSWFYYNKKVNPHTKS